MLPNIKNIIEISNKIYNKNKKNSVINGLNYENNNNLNKDDLQNMGYIDISKKKFLKYIKNINIMNSNIKNAHGCKEPDECYINIKLKKIYIIEKKFQKVQGSACEKIQTVLFKKWHYENLIKDYNIIYIYCLSDWFYTNCNRELEYLDLHNIYYFNGNGNNYKNEIINYIKKHDNIN